MIELMANKASPLVGYNTNVRHKGSLYHIQTEDLGVKRAQIITQLFADGGRIVTSEKTTYDHLVDSEDFAATIKKLMQDQHKRVFIGLRDGVYDEGGTADAAETEVLDHAAAKLIEGSSTQERRYESIQVATDEITGRVSQVPPKPFGDEVLSEKSLDEVILAYLAQDLEQR